MRYLILLRHAKAVRDHEAQTDFERGLTKRGRLEARRAGELIARAGLRPDRALISPARRTSETFAALATNVGEAHFEEDLYLAPARSVLRLARAAGEADTVLVIGHNPGLKEVGLRLSETGGGHNAWARERLELGFPTAWASVFAVDGSPAPDRARLIYLLAPERAPD
ncbi:MAG: histidine phosphatase family protein [Caulobacterales bacterium]|nr:histidine phosphatase family protein [Caulobacterales bacterium]